MTRVYGSKCTDEYRSAADIAKLMRADIKAAVAAGVLPGKAGNYSVTSETYSMGQSIRIEARDLPDMWRQCDGMGCSNYVHTDTVRVPEGHLVLTAEGARIQRELATIHAAFNYDGSDSMTDYYDVNYYGSAEIESPGGARFRAAEKARKARRAEARKAVA